MTTPAAVEPITARVFLFGDTDLVQAMRTSGAADTLRQQLGGFSRTTQDEAVQQLARISAEVLDIDLAMALLGAWSRYPRSGRPADGRLPLLRARTRGAALPPDHDRPPALDRPSRQRQARGNCPLHPAAPGQGRSADRHNTKGVADRTSRGPLRLRSEREHRGQYRCPPTRAADVAFLNATRFRHPARVVAQHQAACPPPVRSAGPSSR